VLIYSTYDKVGRCSIAITIVKPIIILPIDKKLVKQGGNWMTNKLGFTLDDISEALLSGERRGKASARSKG